MTKFLNKLKSNKLLMKILSVLIICVVLCSMLVVPSSAADEEVTDLTGSSWVFNEVLTRPEDNFWDLKLKVGYTFPDLDLSFSFFGITGQSYSSATGFSNYSFFGSPYASGVDPRTTFYNFTSNSWSSENYRLISFTGGSDSDNPELISWILSNAERYVPPAQDSILESFQSILNWITVSLTDSLKIFYVEGQGLTLVGVLGVVSVSISIAFLLISVISNFLKNRG